MYRSPILIAPNQAKGVHSNLPSNDALHVAVLQSEMRMYQKNNIKNSLFKGAELCSQHKVPFQKMAKIGQQKGTKNP